MKYFAFFVLVLISILPINAQKRKKVVLKKPATTQPKSPPAKPVEISPKELPQLKNPNIKPPQDLPEIEETKKCELALRDAPSIRDLKLGMPEDEIVTLFSIKRDYIIRDTDTEGVSSANIFINSPNGLYRSPPSFNGINWLSFKTYLGRIFSFEVSYEPTEIKFENNMQFAQNISNTFKLPLESWDFKGYEGKLICKEFVVKVDAKSNSISIIDTLTEQQIKQKEELKRKAFKP